MKLKSLLISLTLLGSVSQAFATTYHVIDSFQFRAWNSAGFISAMTPVPPNSENCTSPTSLRLNNDHSKVELMESVILAAEANGRKIQVAVNGCIGGYPQVNAVWMLD